MFIHIQNNRIYILILKGNNEEEVKTINNNQPINNQPSIITHIKMGRGERVIN
jgi:hypothetical protein